MKDESTAIQDEQSRFHPSAFILACNGELMMNDKGLIQSKNDKGWKNMSFFKLGVRALLLLLAVSSGYFVVSSAAVRSFYSPGKANEERSADVLPVEAQKSYAGQWLIETIPGENQVHLTLRYRSSKNNYGDDYRFNNNTSFRIATDRLQGLSAAQLSSTGSQVQFQIVRDAGTLACEGWFKEGSGSGHFTYAPNANFAGELRKRGIDAPTDEQQFAMTIHDVSFALMDELSAQGYEKPNLEQLIRLGTHGVTIDYVREMKALGYQLSSIDYLIKMRDHGVTPRFVKEMTALGYTKLSAEELIKTKDHGVNPEFVKELEGAGYGRLPLEQLVRLKDHGVSPAFAKELESAGYGKFTLDELVKIRDHGVNPDFIKSLEAEGYSRLSMEQLVRLKDHGVNPDFIREMKQLGYSNLSIEQLVRLKDHGVNAAFVQKIKSHGFNNLTIEELIKLRDSGVLE